MPELDPIETARHLATTYRQYLLTTFSLQEPELRQQFRDALDVPNAITRGPLLEAQPPFLPGRSLAELVADGVLCPGILSLDGPAMPVRRPLYRHQDRAIERVVRDGRNVVVATGTGSGKTESFLLPVLDHLMREREAGTLGRPGVRALLLYPMNALANDQLKRLRSLLSEAPDVRFGRYTGETQETRAKALEIFRAQNRGEPVVANELLSREEMRAAPPHLLLTNYAMLEYLLLRPRDSEFFDGAGARSWRFIVLDEAHTYDGATGIEMAMLLRRLKDRIGRSSSDPIACVATSATIGRGRRDFPRVASFASELFGEPFEFVEGDPGRQDVVEAEREGWSELNPTGAGLPPESYIDLHRLVSTPGEHYGVSVAEACAKLGISLRGGTPATDDAALHGLLKDDPRLHRLRDLLSSDPIPVEEAAVAVFPDAADPLASATALVALAVRAKPAADALALLPARYHFFARALEGSFVCLEDHLPIGAPGRRLFLARHETCPECARAGRRRAVFELGSCGQCGAEYLIGQVARGNGVDILEPAAGSWDPVTYFLLGPDSVDDEDELAVDGGIDAASADVPVQLCLACGRFSPSLAPDSCPCGENARVLVVEAALPTGQRELHRCLACGIRTTREVVSRFMTGQDAPVAVLASALYESLPPAKGAVAGLDVGLGRKLLVFADSRQDAAFFAPYIGDNHERLLRRRLLVQALTGSAEAERGDLRIQDVSVLLVAAANAAGLFSEEQSRYERERVVRTWLMQEFISWDRRNTPEGVGLLSFRPVRPPGWAPPKPLAEAPWHFDLDESWELVVMLFDSLRRQGAT
ncbi:MAG: DEAD/DEAH box helicase, partial [Actinomycetota bacterium]|nr:DEAD/DEAH box helicase [Actinomycetota bacterium]